MKGWQVWPNARIQLSRLLSFPLRGNGLSKPLDSGLRRNDDGGIPALPGMTARAGAASLIIRGPETVSRITLSGGMCVPRHTFKHPRACHGQKQE